MTNRAYEKQDAATDWAAFSAASRKSAAQSGDWRVFTPNSAEAPTFSPMGLFDALVGHMKFPVAIDFPLHDAQTFSLPNSDSQTLTGYELQMRQFIAEEDEAFQQIHKDYLLENSSEVETFIRSHRSTLEVLVDAVPHLKAAFGADALLQLRVGAEEGTPKVICGVVIWKDSLASAMAALREFDDSWWIDNVKKALGRIVFDYELA